MKAKLHTLPFRRNPRDGIRIRSTAKRAKLFKRFQKRRGQGRFYGYDPAGSSYYNVQVRRKNGWLTLASFPKSQLGHHRALEYGKILAARFPRKTFRVFWPD